MRKIVLALLALLLLTGCAQKQMVPTTQTITIPSVEFALMLGDLKASHAVTSANTRAACKEGKVAPDVCRAFEADEKRLETVEKYLRKALTAPPPPMPTTGGPDYEAIFDFMKMLGKAAL